MKIRDKNIPNINKYMVILINKGISASLINGNKTIKVNNNKAAPILIKSFDSNFMVLL